MENFDEIREAVLVTLGKKPTQAFKNRVTYVEHEFRVEEAFENVCSTVLHAKDVDLSVLRSLHLCISSAHNLSQIKDSSVGKAHDIAYGLFPNHSFKDGDSNRFERFVLVNVWRDAVEQAQTKQPSA